MGGEVIYTPTWVVTTTKLIMFSLNLEEDVRDSTGGDNYCPVLDLALRPGEGQDARTWHPGPLYSRCHHLALPGGDSDYTP